MREWFPDARLAGMDLDRQSLDYARARAAGVALVQASVSGATLPLAGRSCDVVVALHVVEHLEDPDRFLEEAARILVPGGLLALATPNPAGLGARITGAGWKGHRDDHISLRPPAEWRRAVEAAGFQVRREGTTGLSGLWLFDRTPLAWLNRAALLLWGFFPWRHGEAYICLATSRL
jgi:malonyl-CoA O-methyltransferase